jgi:protein-L-isoaspartate(D-aspartate) O-methyltransferase
MIPMSEAEVYINQLADTIAKEVEKPAVIAAFRAVPRHRFLMRGFHAFDQETRQRQHYKLENTEQDEWLKRAYSNQALMIEIGDSPSSSSEPILMAHMLDALDVQTGMHVLEIGTGTGYNAALLAELVGESGEVYTIDRQAHLCEAAEKLLPPYVKVHYGNGLLGYPDAAPYDRIIATASHTRIPPAWIEQLAIGGKLLGNIGMGGGLLLAQRSESGIESHYIEQAGYFMPMIDENVAPIEIQLEPMDIKLLGGKDFRFFLEWLYPDTHFSFVQNPDTPEEADVQFHSGRKGASLKANGVLRLLHGDASYLDEVSAMIARWTALGKPKRGDFHIKLEADGRQMLYIYSEPIREL